MIVDISTETAEKLFADILVQDYKNNLRSLKELKIIKQENGSLQDYQKEDYKNFKRAHKAYKTLSQYYLIDLEEEALDAL